MGKTRRRPPIAEQLIGYVDVDGSGIGNWIADEDNLLSRVDHPPNLPDFILEALSAFEADVGKRA